MSGDFEDNKRHWTILRLAFGQFKTARIVSGNLILYIFQPHCPTHTKNRHFMFLVGAGSAPLLEYELLLRCAVHDRAIALITLSGKGPLLPMRNPRGEADALRPKVETVNET